MWKGLVTNSPCFVGLFGHEKAGTKSKIEADCVVQRSERETGNTRTGTN
jgi:hypothetical protein